MWHLEKFDDELQNKKISYAAILDYMQQYVKDPEKLNGIKMFQDGRRSTLVLEDEFKLTENRTIKRISTPFKDKNNNLLGRLFIFEDITEKKVFENLLFSESEYRFIVEEATDAIALTDDKLKIINVNTKLCDLLGYSRKELINKSYLDLIDPADLAINPVKLAEVLNNKTILVKRTLRTKDNRLVYVEVNAKKASDSRIMNFMRDISNRKDEIDELKKDLKAGVYSKLMLKLSSFKHGEKASMNLYRICLYINNINNLWGKKNVNENGSIKTYLIKKQKPFHKFESIIKEYSDLTFPLLEHLCVMASFLEPELPKLMLKSQLKNLYSSLLKKTQKLKKCLMEYEIHSVTNFTIKNAEGLKFKTVSAVKDIKESLNKLSLFLDTYFSSNVYQVVNSIVKIYGSLTNEVKINLICEHKKIKGIINSNELREVISIIFENAFESLFYKGSNEKNINLYIEQNEGRAIIKIEDNGTGVGHKYKDLIFKEGYSSEGIKHAGLDYHTHYHVYKNMVVICFWIIIILQGQGL